MQGMIRAASIAAAGLALAASTMHAQVGSGAPPSSLVKVAYVRTQLLLQAAPGKAQMDSILTRENALYEGELSKLRAVIDSIQQDLVKNDKLTQDQKNAKGKLLMEKQQAFSDKQAELTQKFNAKQAELAAPIQEAMLKVLDDIRVEDGYTFILSGDGVVAADKNLDITEKVLARLRTLAAKT